MVLEHLVIGFPYFNDTHFMPNKENSASNLHTEPHRHVHFKDFYGHTPTLQ